MLEDLEKERYDRYDDWEVYESEVKCMESRVKSIQENLNWYNDKLKDVVDAPSF